LFADADPTGELGEARAFEIDMREEARMRGSDRNGEALAWMLRSS